LPSRPGYVALSGTPTYVSVFRDDAIGPWAARHGLTSDQYQAEFDAQKQNGFFPICVQGGGSGDSTRYAAIFAQRDTPLGRVWTMTGAPTPSLVQFDNAMKTVMQSKGVRAAALTIAKNGVVHLAHGYTWAEPGYAITQPNTLFRLASVSKAFTAAAIYTLIQAGKVHADDKVFPMLGIVPFSPLPGQPPDPQYANITVQDLINHLGGWDAPLANFDPVFASRTIATAMGLNTFPSKKQVASYMMGRGPLQFAPGTTPQLKDSLGNPRNPYSNFGYVMLGLVVEHFSNKQFADYVKQNVLQPLDISDVYLARTLMSQRRLNEALAEDPGLVPTALDPNSNQLLPAAYGGFVLETMDSGGGLIASAPALAALVRHYAAWSTWAPGTAGVWLRAPGSARTGAESGARTRISSRANGIDYAFLFDTRWNLEGAVDNKGTAYIDQFGTNLEAQLDALNLP
jgi:CubicO group peptidase (beta-lactamase class C family)